MRLPETQTLPFPVFVVDDEGRIEDGNAAFEDVLPGSVGLPFSRTLFGAEAPSVTSDGDWRDNVARDVPFALRTVPITGSSGPRYYDLLFQPLAAQGAGPARTLGILVDVTEQTYREAENAAILDTAVDSVVMIDEGGIIETFNRAACALFGYAPEEIIGTPVSRLMPEPHRSRHDGYVNRYIATGEKRIIGLGRELEAVHKDGRRIPIYLAVSEISLQGRRRFTGIIRDLSEQHAAREALSEQREKLAHVGRLSTMGEMTASIAHEINQPLTAISMYAQSALRMLGRGDVDTEKLATALEKLNTQSLRAGAIIERIQRFARAQESHRELLDVNALLQDLVKLAEGDARMHDVVITFDLAGDLPRVRCDPVQIQQVALNLIRNAIDAMRETGDRTRNAMSITTRVAGGRVEVAVSDQGPGVAEDQQKLLFKPFHTTKKDGMGMGLSICRTIVAEHGGELSFRSNPEGGATFFFSLPAAGHE